MEINAYKKQLDQIILFKNRVINSVQQRQFDEVSLGEIIQDTFVKNKTVVTYDDKALKELDANAYFYMVDDDYNFIFSKKNIQKIKNKNLEELEQSKKLKPFGEFFERITHEVKHGLYDTFFGYKPDVLYNQALKIVAEDVADKIIDEDFPILCNKCVDGVYYKSSQVSAAITRIANKNGPKNNKWFQKILFLLFLDDIKNESEAYLEGFKAKREILGDKGRFAGMKFAEAIEDNKLMQEIVQEGYFNKFVPVKKIHRYF